MDSARWQHVKQILDEALDRPPGKERARYLDAACAGDDALRAEVVSLIEAHAAAAGSFLDTGAVALPEAADAHLFQRDARIGPYRILEEVGRGGMGTVYRAARDDAQYQREVALKIVRPGLYTDAVVERFLTERQILATLEHPNIARLYDGGVTEDGRPYFVMEYVQGQPLNRYCDAKRLAVQKRLQLFVEVARAVAYAHTKLVVHRDLKPSNILVAEDESGRPAVKLLDFGLAKLLREEGAAPAAPATQTGLQLMTPEYAAPEQVRGRPVSAATDVYALGVVLYRLLTGRRPYRFQTRTPSHVERVICEVTPTRPSTVVMQSEDDEAAGKASTATLGRARRTEAGRLRRTLRGDLDTIILKALRKEPERRYASAESLAADVERYLGGLPIAARRDSVGYRAAKFVRRHRWGVAAAVVFALLLIGYAATVTVQAGRIAAERDRAQAEAAKAEQTAAFLTSLFESGDPHRTAGDTLTAYDLLGRGAQRLARLEDQPQVRAQMLGLIGEANANMGYFDRADSLLAEGLALLGGPDAAPARPAIVDLLRKRAEVKRASRAFEDALPLLRQALALQRALPPGAAEEAALDEARLTMTLALTLRDADRPDSAAVLARQALTLFDAHGADPLARLRAQTDLAYILRGRDRLAEAESLYYDALPPWRAEAASDSSLQADLAAVLNNVAYLHVAQQRNADAIPLYREALALQRRIDKGSHRFTAVLMNNLAAALEREERFDEVEAVARDVIALEERHRPAGHWRIGAAHGALGSFYLRRSRPAEALPLLHAQHENYVASLGADHSWTRNAAFELGAALVLAGRAREAAPLLQQKTFLQDGIPQPLTFKEQTLVEKLAQHYAARGDRAQAARYRRLLAPDASEP